MLCSSGVFFAALQAQEARFLLRPFVKKQKGTVSHAPSASYTKVTMGAAQLLSQEQSGGRSLGTPLVLGQP